MDPSLNVEVTALKFDTDGLTLGVGTSNGNCILYDIRSKTPLYVKEHQYGLPVIDITFHNSSKNVISTDKKVVKIWERHEPAMGRVLTNIETPADINAMHCVADKRGKRCSSVSQTTIKNLHRPKVTPFFVCLSVSFPVIIGQSGLLMMAGEQSRMMLYFVPQLGPAPRWCSFLEGLTEELEETAGQNVYEDYKFVTKAEVEELGASGLIGTPMLKGYMHGFFLEMKLYNKLRAVSKPFEYEEHRRKKIEAKIEEKRQSRIVAQKRLPKVNKDLAEKMIKAKNKDKTDSGGTGGTEKEDDEGLIDSRFASLFKREEFERDELSMEFKLRNPSKGHNQKKNGNDDSDDELQNLYAPVEEQDSESDEDDYDQESAEEVEQAKGRKPSRPHDDDDSDIDEIRAEEEESEYQEKSRKRKGRKGDDSDEEGEIFRATKRAVEKQKTSASRAQSAERKSASLLKARKSIHSSVSETSSSSSSSKGGPKMYEIADGVSSSRAVFSHTEESKGQRRADRVIGLVPLSERITQGKRGKNSWVGLDWRVSYYVATCVST